MTFDPWRQEQPKPKPKVKQDTHPTEEVCVRFRGLRAGINVWLPADEHDNPDIEAQRILVECARKIASPGFAYWGVHLTPQPGAFKLGDNDSALYIAVIEDHARERAIDALALALRDAQHSAKQVLEKARIKPFIV